jgi:ParB-like chromosome segregation protein Spo0J
MNDEHIVVHIKVSEVKLDGDNPNRMPENTLKRLNKSIEKWGNTQPIVVDKNTMLLADGEHRLKTYKENNKETIPAILIDFKNDAERRAYRQAANKIRGTHDEKLDTAEYLRLIESGAQELLLISTGLSMTQVETHIRKKDPHTNNEQQETISTNCPMCKGTGTINKKKHK